MGNGEIMLGGNLAIDQHPIQGGVENNTPSCFVLQKPGTSAGTMILNKQDSNKNGHFHANQSHFHLNGFAQRLVLKLRQKVTWKWSWLLLSCTVCHFVAKMINNMFLIIFFVRELHLSTTWPCLSEEVIVDNSVYS